MMKAGIFWRTIKLPMQNQMRMPVSKAVPIAERRRPVMLEYENTRDTAKQTDTASGRQIDVARKNDEQHSHRERGGDRQLGYEQREIARAQKLRRHDGEEPANDDERDHQRKIAK